MTFLLVLEDKLTLLSRAPNRLGSDSLAVNSLCVFMQFLLQDFYYLADASFLVPHGHLCTFLVMGEEFIDTRIFLGIYLDLVGIPIKTYFILRYARYAIKYDYLNLIFELC